MTGTKRTSSVMFQNMFHLSMVLLCVKCPDQSQYCKTWDASRLIALDVHYYLQFSTIDNTWSGKPISWQRAINVTDQYNWTHPWLNGLVCLSIQSLCVLRSLSAGESWKLAYSGSLTDSDAEAALEFVLAVVEEGAEDQRERQREQLLF